MTSCRVIGRARVRGWFRRFIDATVVDEYVYTGYRCSMTDTTTIRISRDTHARVTRLAAERHETIDETVSRAVRALRQDALARDLAEHLTEEETAWLDAHAG